MTVSWDLFDGSCLDTELGLPALPDKSIDVVICDPPYDPKTHKAQRRGHTGYEERPSKRATFNRSQDLLFDPITEEEMLEVAAEMSRLTRRWILAFCSFELVSSWKVAFESAGLDYVRCCVWVKKCAAPQFTGDRPGTGAEAIVVAHPKGRKSWNGGGKHGVFQHAIEINRSGKKPRIHTAQKPLPLMEELVSLFSRPGELVCDPYAGSATTGEACIRLGRSFLGWELHSGSTCTACKDPATCPGWAGKARRRLQEASEAVLAQAA